MEKEEFKWTILITHQKRKIMNFLLKSLPLQNIVPHVMFIIWNFTAIFLFQYSLIGIVKPKFFRRNEIWCRIWEIQDLQLLIKAGELHPSLLIHIIDRPAPQGGIHPQPSAEMPDWCTCLKCRDMPTQAERICCGRPANQCQSLLPVWYKM